MRMQVTEKGDEVCIELLGVAGRHQRILQALMENPLGLGPVRGEGCMPALEAADVNVRAGTDAMHIRLKGRSAHSLEALSIYRYLRHVLIEGQAASGGALERMPSPTANA
jgi:hypothetical protein